MGQGGAAAHARHHLSSAPPGAPTPPPATAVYVLYGTESVDLSWIPDDAPVVLVANDDRFRWEDHLRTNLVRLDAGSNVGFGAAVNAALPHVTGARLVIVNPDTRLSPEHWEALIDAGSHEIVTIPMVEPDGTPTLVVRPHYTPLTLTLTAWRVGRLLRWRRLRARVAAAPDAAATGARAASAWVSGGCVSLPTDLLRAVGGFDERYFLYFEDADLGRRLGERFPGIVVRTAGVRPAVHGVGGTAVSPEDRARARRAHAASAVVYATERRSLPWRLAAALASARIHWLDRAARPKATRGR